MGKKEGKRGIKIGFLKVAFWNVAGLKNKHEKFWKELEEWDVMILTFCIMVGH